MFMEDWKFCLAAAMGALYFIVTQASPIAILLFVGYYYSAITLFNKEKYDEQ